MPLPTASKLALNTHPQPSHSAAWSRRAGGYQMALGGCTAFPLLRLLLLLLLIPFARPELETGTGAMTTKTLTGKPRREKKEPEKYKLAVGGESRHTYTLTDQVAGWPDATCRTPRSSGLPRGSRRNRVQFFTE